MKWCLLFLAGCAGEPFSLAPGSLADGDLSEDPSAGSDRAARDAGLDAPASEPGGGEERTLLPPVDGPPSEPVDDVHGSGDSSPPFDAPWPLDVVVERMPAPNCFVDFQGQNACCRAVNQPPVECEAQHQPHYCESCPK